jgi:hypothetical protein
MANSVSAMEGLKMKTLLGDCRCTLLSTSPRRTRDDQRKGHGAHGCYVVASIMQMTADHLCCHSAL